MKTRVSFIVMILMIFPLLVMPQNRKAKGNKEVVSITKDLKENIEKVEISDNLSVEIQRSNRNSYVLTTDENLADLVVIRVQGNTLKIHTRTKIVKSKKLEVFLKLGKLNEIILNDDAELKLTDNFNSENMRVVLNHKSQLEMDQQVKENIDILLASKSSAKLDLQSKNVVINSKGNSSLKAKIDAKDLKMMLDKSADAKMEGKVDHVNFNLEDRSNLNAKKLKANTAVLISKNKADIYVQASKSIEIDAEGKSKIYVYGNPDIKIKGFTDKSRIIKK